MQNKKKKLQEKIEMIRSGERKKMLLKMNQSRSNLVIMSGK